MNKKILSNAGIVVAVAAVVFGLALFGLQAVRGSPGDTVVRYSLETDAGPNGTNGAINGETRTGSNPAAPNRQASREIPVFNPYDQARDPRAARLPPLALAPRDVLIINGALDPTPTATPPPGKDTVSTYSYDIARERWVRQTQLVESQGTHRNNTIIIRLENDNPVKEIVIDEAIVARGSAPLLAIDGKFDATSTGKIHIGVLALKRVDAAELEINADVVRTQLQNVIAKDDELRLELRAVNVVRIGRGGATSLFLGKDGVTEENNSEDNKKDIKAKTITGLRVDRIVIKGPQAGLGFVETILIKRTGVFGKIDIRNVAIQDLILQDVSLDDNITNPTPAPTPTLTPLAIR